MQSKVVNWISGEDLARLPTSQYWNDEVLEHEKVWQVENQHDLSVVRHIREGTNLEKALEKGLRFVEESRSRALGGTVVDLGAGVCWSSSLLARREDVEHVYAVEMSRHRLLNIAPIIMKQLDAPAGKITRVLGDFCDLRFDADSIDLVVMVQAYHHAVDPTRLMREVARVLRPGGAVVVSGEIPISRRRWMRKMVRHNLRGALHALGLASLMRSLTGRAVVRPNPLFGIKTRTLFPVDKVKGDRHATRGMVRRTFGCAGLTIHFQSLDPEDMFPDCSATCNYIGFKPIAS